MDLLKELQFILIDDFSDEVLDESYFNQFNLNLIVARVQTDIMWNQSGAHNLGSHLATSDWLFMMDVDHWIDEQATDYVVKLEKHNESSYFFSRYYMDKNLAAAPNIYLISRSKFWKLGGYDEDFAGCYGYEDKLLHRLIKDHTRSHLGKIIVNVDNAPTRDLNRDRERNRLILNNKIKQYESGSYKNGKVIRFEWKKTVDKSLIT